MSSNYFDFDDKDIKLISSICESNNQSNQISINKSKTYDNLIVKTHVANINCAIS
jgi:hypothetical protein